MSQTETMRILTVEDLEVAYGGIRALLGVSLKINAGEIVTIIGSNGAGKSTLLRTIAGDKEYSGGKILFEGKNLPQHVYQFVEHGISLVPEGRRIFVNLTVRENLLVGAYKEKQKAVIAQRMEEVFELFPRLKERYKQVGGTLSGGEQQMLAVGRAMMAAPKLMMLDEPSLGLAPIVISEMFEKFKQINRTHGTTLLIVEQNAQLALETADRAYVLGVGKIVKEGVASEMLDDPFIQETYMGVR